MCFDKEELAGVEMIDTISALDPETTAARGMSVASQPAHLALQPRLEALIRALYPKDSEPVSPAHS
jgi:hypothetical protein